MKDLIETLQIRWKSYGHWRISITLGDAVYYCITTNSMAVDAASDQYYDDNDNSERHYESRYEAQESLVNEIIYKNHLDL